MLDLVSTVQYYALYVQCFSYLVHSMSESIMNPAQCCIQRIQIAHQHEAITIVSTKYLFCSYFGLLPTPALLKSQSHFTLVCFHHFPYWDNLIILPLGSACLEK